MSEAKTKTVGIVGHMYENRKSGEVGKLISRDEKCKTVMLELEDGSTQSINYSTFRAQWKKQKIESVDTEAVSDESDGEPVEKKKRGRKAKEPKEPKVPALRPVDMCQMMIEPMKKFGEKLKECSDKFELISFSPKAAFIVKYAGKRVLELYGAPKFKEFRAFFRDDTFFKSNVWHMTVTGEWENEKFNMKKYIGILYDAEQLNIFLDDMVTALVKYAGELDEVSRKKEEEKLAKKAEREARKAEMKAMQKKR